MPSLGNESASVRLPGQDIYGMAALNVGSRGSVAPGHIRWHCIVALLTDDLQLPYALSCTSACPRRSHHYSYFSTCQQLIASPTIAETWRTPSEVSLASGAPALRCSPCLSLYNSGLVDVRQPFGSLYRHVGPLKVTAPRLDVANILPW